jgi:2-dehydro-3-deoxyphosphogluconate aldolase/(4S)-4-hydroxy-2-oxoglutarate aldolase
MDPSALLTRLKEQRLAAIVRGHDAEAALRTVIALAEEGIGLIEVSLTTAEAVEVISRASREVGEMAWVGAGTVVSGDDVLRVRDAGARWIVTPAFGEGVHVAVEENLPLLAGALTPTEAVAVMRAGAAAVKLFPASLGGPRYLRALRDPFPDIPFVPVGGVGADDVHAYLDGGAVAVGVGSPLVGDAADGGDLADLRLRARRFITALRATEATG